MLDKLNQPKGSTIGVLKDGRSTQQAIDDLGNGVTASLNVARYVSSASQALFPKLISKLTDYRHGVGDYQKEFRVWGFGSSVGNGATLPDKDTQTPVAKFYEHLLKAVNRGSIYPFSLANKSVDGSNINDFLVREWPAVEAGGIFPDIAVFAYGMNDFPSAQYNAGMSFGPNGFKARLRQAIQKVRDRGGDVVLMTTPHPYIEVYDWTMPTSVDMIWPQFAAKPVAADVMIPPLSQSNVTFPFNGVNITQGVRFLRGNDAMREVACEMGCVLLDVEKYWFEAVGTYGNVQLFNVGQTVHPNLFGHQKSYWRACEEFFAGVNSSGWITPDVKENTILDVGGTGLYPAKREADVDIQMNGGRSRGHVIRDKFGRVIKETFQSGRVEETFYTVDNPTPSAPGYSTMIYREASRVKGLFANGETHTISIPNRTEAELTVNVWTSAQQTWAQYQKFLIVNREGVITIALIGSIDTTPGEGGSSTPTDGRRLFSLAAGTNAVVITVKQDNASLKYKIEGSGV